MPPLLGSGLPPKTPVSTIDAPPQATDVHLTLTSGNSSRSSVVATALVEVCPLRWQRVESWLRPGFAGVSPKRVSQSSNWPSMTSPFSL